MRSIGEYFDAPTPNGNHSSEALGDQICNEIKGFIPPSTAIIFDVVYLMINLGVIAYEIYKSKAKHRIPKCTLIVNKDPREVSADQLRILRLLVADTDLAVFFVREGEINQDDIYALFNFQGRVCQLSSKENMTAAYPAGFHDQSAEFLQPLLRTVPYYSAGRNWKAASYQVLFILVAAAISGLAAYKFLYDEVGSLPEATALNENARKIASWIFFANVNLNGLCNTATVMLVTNPTWQALLFAMANVPDNGLSIEGNVFAKTASFDSSFSRLIGFFCGTISVLAVIKWVTIMSEMKSQRKLNEKSSFDWKHDSRAFVEGAGKSCLMYGVSLTIRFLLLLNFALVNIMEAFFKDNKVEGLVLFSFCVSLNFIGFLALEKSYSYCKSLGNFINILATSLMRFVFTEAMIGSCLFISKSSDLFIAAPALWSYWEEEKRHNNRYKHLAGLFREQLNGSPEQSDSLQILNDHVADLYCAQASDSESQQQSNLGAYYYRFTALFRRGASHESGLPTVRLLPPGEFDVNLLA